MAIATQNRLMAQLDDLPIGAPALEEAIDSHPIVVGPETRLVEVISLMNQTRGNSCTLCDGDSLPEEIPMREGRSSCVLVMREGQLLGIFTERDIVRLTANSISFAEVNIAEVMAQPVVTLPKTAFQDIFAALFLFRRYRIRHLPIVDENGQLVGIISPESIRRVLRPANLLKLRRVSDVMSSQVIQAPLTASVLNLARLMAENRVSCVVITEEDGEGGFLPVGIVTERDIMQFQSLQLNLSKTQAEAVMSTPLFLLDPKDSLWTVHQEMQQRRVRRLVVSWNWGRGLGIVTQTSLLRVFDPMEMYGIVETLQQTVAQLEAEKLGRSAKGNAGSKLSAVVESNGLHSLQPLEALQSADYNATKNRELSTVLSTIQGSIESLVKEENLSRERQRERLNSVLADLKKMQAILG